MIKKTYTNTLAEIETNIQENEHLLEKYQENNVDIAKSISNIIEFAGNLRNIIESSRMADRREIFGILLSNSVIIEREARISLKKPFDSLLKSNGYLSWFPALKSIQKECYEEVLSLTSDLNKINLPKIDKQ